MALGPEIRSSSTKNVLHLYIIVCLPTSFKAANIKDWSVGTAIYLTPLHKSDRIVRC